MNSHSEDIDCPGGPGRTQTVCVPVPSSRSVSLKEGGPFGEPSFLSTTPPPPTPLEFTPFGRKIALLLSQSPSASCFGQLLGINYTCINDLLPSSTCLSFPSPHPHPTPHPSPASILGFPWPYFPSYPKVDSILG